MKIPGASVNSDERSRVSGGDGQKPHRLVALSDGVFSIGLTILVIDLVAASASVESGEPLSQHLLRAWPTLLAYGVGFMSIFVCWVNNHRVFHYVTRVDTGLMWVTGLQLALVATVPLPTAVLAANLTSDGRRTAFILYGITYVLMAISFWGLSTYVDRRGLADPSRDPERYVGMLKIYRFGLVWTVISLGVAILSVYPAIVMWSLMFVVFAMPAEFAHYMYLRSERRDSIAEESRAR